LPVFSGERAKNGGVQGEEIFCPRAENPPPARQRGAEQKNCFFLLEEKIGRAQIKNCEQNFSLSERASASGGGAERQNSAFGFSRKKVRISFRVRSSKKLRN